MERVKKMRLSLSGLQVVLTPFPSVHKKTNFSISRRRVWPRDCEVHESIGHECRRVPPRSCPLCRRNTHQSGAFVTPDPWWLYWTHHSAGPSMDTQTVKIFNSSKLLRFWLRMEKVFATMIKTMSPLSLETFKQKCQYPLWVCGRAVIHAMEMFLSLQSAGFVKCMFQQFLVPCNFFVSLNFSGP